MRKDDDPADVEDDDSNDSMPRTLRPPLYPGYALNDSTAPAYALEVVPITPHPTRLPPDECTTTERPYTGRLSYRLNPPTDSLTNADPVLSDEYTTPVHGSEPLS